MGLACDGIFCRGYVAQQGLCVAWGVETRLSCCRSGCTAVSASASAVICFLHTMAVPQEAKRNPSAHRELLMQHTPCMLVYQAVAAAVLSLQSESLAASALSPRSPSPVNAIAARPRGCLSAMLLAFFRPCADRAQGIKVCCLTRCCAVLCCDVMWCAALDILLLSLQYHHDEDRHYRREYQRRNNRRWACLRHHITLRHCVMLACEAGSCRLHTMWIFAYNSELAACYSMSTSCQCPPVPDRKFLAFSASAPLPPPPPASPHQLYCHMY